MKYNVKEFGKTEIAIIGIVILEAIALMKGINGVMFGTALATIAGIAGFALKEKLQ